MTYTITFLPTAEQDIIEAHEWYEEKSRGLGERFQSELRERINIIKQYPDRFPVRNKFYPVNKFPLPHYL